MPTTQTSRNTENGTTGDLRLPPHSEEFEASFLGELLEAGKDATAGFLEDHPGAAHYLYDLRHQTIFNVIEELSRADRLADVVSVGERLKATNRLDDAGGIQYLQHLPDKAVGALTDRIWDVRELAFKRHYIAASARISAAAYNGHTSLELSELAEAELYSIVPENKPNEKPIADLVTTTLAELEHAVTNQGKLRGIATGFIDLDRKLHGLKPGQVFVIAARPSVGKTSIALNIAERVAVDDGIPVGIFSLEMSAEELSMRLITSRARIASDKAQEGTLIERDMKRLALAAGKIRKAPLHIGDEAGISIGQLRAKARRMARRHKIKLLVIDYLQLVRPTRRNDSRNVEVSEVSAAIKALAKELNVPIILLSQLNRDSAKHNRRPMLCDLRDSGSIEQDADIVGLLHPPNPEENAVELLIDKHRNGPRGMIHLTFLKEFTRFESGSPEQSQ
jgi:replicative DNA helicase